MTGHLVNKVIGRKPQTTGSTKSLKRTAAFLFSDNSKTKSLGPYQPPFTGELTSATDNKTLHHHSQRKGTRNREGHWRRQHLRAVDSLLTALRLLLLLLLMLMMMMMRRRRRRRRRRTTMWGCSAHKVCHPKLQLARNSTSFQLPVASSSLSSQLGHVAAAA